MNTFTEQRLQEIQEKGYDLDFGQLTGKGWQIWKKVTIPILMGGILVGIPAVLIYALASFALTGIGFSEWAEMMKDPAALQYMQEIQRSWDYQLKMMGLYLIMTVLFAPIAPGFLKMCHDADRHDSIRFGVLFKYYSPKYYGKILVITLITFVLATVPSLLLQTVLPFIGSIISIVLSVTVYLLLALALPLIIFAEASAGDAIKYSVSLTSKNFFLILAFLLVGVLLALSGVVLCCIGVLFSASYSYITHYLLYKQIVGFEKTGNEDEFVAATSAMD